MLFGDRTPQPSSSRKNRFSSTSYEPSGPSANTCPSTAPAWASTAAPSPPTPGTSPSRNSSVFNNNTSSVPPMSLSPLLRRPRFQDDGAGEQIENTIIRSDNCDTAKVTA
jgi:hypothetical protein